MKRVLITGAHGYIGHAFLEYVKGDPVVVAEGISLQAEQWKNADFSQYDSVVHLAGIAHRKETSENRQLYFDVNRDLTIQVAEKAKREHVKQFIFMSTMSVYGKDVGTITPETQPAPVSQYGISKYEAEQQLKKLDCESFHVAIVRPPMVYGRGCKGNFNAIRRFAESSPVFPKVDNRRSMIFIDNLCSFLKGCVETGASGTYCPQDRQYVRTDEMVRKAAAAIGRKVHLSPFLGIFIRMAMPFSQKLRKAFGTLIYENMECPISFDAVGFDEAISSSMGE